MRNYRPVKFVFSFLTLRGIYHVFLMPAVFMVGLIALLETWLIAAEHIKPLSMSPFTVLGVVIGLLLTFRTNTSYDRFWEGRKAWGSIVNRSRDLARQLAAFEIDHQIQKAMIEDLLIFCNSLKEQLQSRSAKDVCQPLIDFSKQAVKLRQDGKIDSHQLQLLDSNISILIDQQGICERIQNTPMPVAYILYLRSFIFAYCMALPFGLAAEVGWATPVVIALVALSFFSIDRIGGLLEDPFKKNMSTIDIDRILAVIQSDLRRIAGARTE